MSSTYRTQLTAGEEAAARYALAVPRTLTAGLGGVRLGRSRGSSMEFQEYREYQPGDDLRHLDWSAYARSDRLTVKLFHEEVDPHVDLVIDGSRSMAPEGAADPKAGATAALAAFFAQAALQAGFSQSAWLAAELCRPLGRRGTRPSEWQGLGFEFGGSLHDSLERLPPGWRPRGLRILLSDLLCREEPRSILARLAVGAAAVVVVQVLSDADAEPPARGFERLVDAETGEVRDLLVDAETVRRYLAALEEHQRTWRDACREIGATLVTLRAERAVDGWPAEELWELVEREVLELR